MSLQTLLPLSFLKTTCFLLWGSLLPAWSGLYGAHAGFDSFEDGVPDHWVESRSGSLSTSPDHFKHGAQSLRWDWKSGDRIRIDRGVGDTSRTGGYGGKYGKATFGVWLYQREPLDAMIRFEFREGDRVTGHFDFDLNFTGWRRAHLWFERDFEGEVGPDTDNIRLLAPEGVDAGTTFVDLVVYNGILDYRRQHLPDDQTWETPNRELRDERFPLPSTVSADAREGIERIHRRFVRSIAGSGTVNDQTLARLEERLAEWEIVDDDHGIRGRPLVRYPDFYEEEGIEGVYFPRHAADLMLDLARAYHRTENTGYREQLAEWYVLMARYLKDQGMVAGSGFSWNWYPGRSFADATLLMRDVLADAGLLEDTATYMDYNYRYSEIFDDASIDPHMDYFYFDKRYRLFGILLKEDPAEVVRHLRAYARRLSLDILKEDGANGFKPDGSAYHHWGHYFAYAVYCVDSLVDVVQALSDTPFRITPDAYDRLKESVLAMRLYANKRSVPLSLHGRHPFNYGQGQNVRPHTFRNLARANTYGVTGDIDPDLGAAYLRLDPDSGHSEAFHSAGIEAEAHPEGNWSMNYAGINIHRRDHWLALAKGYSRYVWAAEIYQSENRFGRYLSHGSLQIHAAGDPVNFHDSGYREDGWDWNRIDGTTVIYLPIDQLEAPRPGTEMARSNQTFVGGLSHRERHGAFVMILEGHERHDPSFRGKKSYFFFDERIVALGSGIRNDDTEHPTHTNLFQKHLPERDMPIVVNEHTVADFPLEHGLSRQNANWLIDTQNTGYLVPSGHAVHFARQRQESRDHRNRNDTEGDFATAWIDHGTAPEDAGYEYLIVIDTYAEEMKDLAGRARSGDGKPYDVIRKDSRAHIVRDRSTGLTGAVLFEAGDVDGTAPVAASDAPVLLMFGRDGDNLHLTVTDPDLHLEDNASRPNTVNITLEGAWDLVSQPENVTVDSRNRNRTVLAFECRHGFSTDVELAPVRR